MPPNPPAAPHDPSKPLPGRLGNLTIPQQHTLEKFKEALKAEGESSSGLDQRDVSLIVLNRMVRPRTTRRCYVVAVLACKEV